MINQSSSYITIVGTDKEGNHKETEVDILAVAEAVGIDAKHCAIELHRKVDEGELVAITYPCKEEPYPSIDVELRLKDDPDTQPILLSKSEQAREDMTESDHRVLTYLYSRNDNYVAVMAADTRPDSEVDKNVGETQIMVSGEPDGPVRVISENPHVRYASF